MNETPALLRYFGKQYGFYPSNDPIKAWDCDATSDFIMGLFDQFALPSVFGKTDADTQTKWREAVQELATKLGEKLQKSNHRFLCADQLTTPDFAMAGIAFTCWKNP